MSKFLRYRAPLPSSNLAPLLADIALALVARLSPVSLPPVASRGQGESSTAIIAAVEVLHPTTASIQSDGGPNLAEPRGRPERTGEGASLPSSEIRSPFEAFRVLSW